MGFEPTTSALRKLRSTVELGRHLEHHRLDWSRLSKDSTRQMKPTQRSLGETHLRPALFHSRSHTSICSEFLATKASRLGAAFGRNQSSQYSVTSNQ